MAHCHTHTYTQPHTHDHNHTCSCGCDHGSENHIILRIVLCVASFAAVHAALHFIVSLQRFSAAFYLIPYAIIGYDVLLRAVKNIFHGEIYSVLSNRRNSARLCRNAFKKIHKRFNGHPPRLRKYKKRRVFTESHSRYGNGRQHDYRKTGRKSAFRRGCCGWLKRIEYGSSYRRSTAALCANRRHRTQRVRQFKRRANAHRYKTIRRIDCFQNSLHG